ncbi:efflux RND transporter periplasmic adaptor subunit [bacterium]|nr:efflux RND transporter periplasmic adaptor subunit [bacterium]
MAKALTTILIFIFLVWSISYSQPQTLVEVDHVKRMEFHDQITLVSRTKAIRSSQVVATISGQVVEINAEEGKKIRRGAPLVTIAKERFQMALDAKKAEANQARARSVEALRTFNRSKDLYKRQLVPDSKIDTDSSLAIAAEERYRQLMAEHARIAFDLQSCIIKAPFAGYTGRQLVEVGEWVSPGTPVFELVDPSVVKVTVDLPERYFGQLQVGSSVAISLSGDASKILTGKVTGISPRAVESTHTFPVFVTVDNKHGYLGGGMLVKATLSLKKSFTSFAVSKDAIVRQGLQTFVFTVADGKAVRIPVVTSSTSGELIAVEGEGLAEGMPVIVRGNERIFPGSPVRVPEQSSDGTHTNSTSK